MLTYEVLPDDPIFILEPHGPLSATDFRNLDSEVEHQLARHESIRGVLIHTQDFPGWKDFAGMLRHLRFVREHHQDIERVAVATDSATAALLPKTAELFVRAEVKEFDFDERDDALAWLRENRE